MTGVRTGDGGAGEEAAPGSCPPEMRYPPIRGPLDSGGYRPRRTSVDREDVIAVCRVAARDLGTSRQAPRRTREWARDVLRRWELDPELDRALLVLNELVTNAVVHSPGGASCRITVDGGALEIVVTDAGDGPPRRALRRADAPDRTGWEQAGGRGLQIVAAVADSWGTTFTAGRTGVWARWDLGDDWRYTEACVCPRVQAPPSRAGSSDGESLASGGTVVAIAGPWDALDTADR